MSEVEMQSGARDRGRFTGLERSELDFPFYAGEPVELSLTRWAVVMGAIALAFVALTMPLPLLNGPIGLSIGAVLFPAIPLLALALVAPRGWTALFKPLRGIDFVWMVLFAILNIAATLSIGLVVFRLIPTTPNPVGAILANASNLERALFFARTLPQLFGEEVVSILPFLAVLYLLAGRLCVGRRTAMVMAALATGLLFAVYHLPTYGWNVVQAVSGVGVARLVLLLPYIMTKNIWVSTGAHIINDWVMIGGTLMLAGLAGNP